MNGNRRRRFSPDRELDRDYYEVGRRRQRRRRPSRSATRQRKRGFFRSSVKGIGGRWTTEDWYFTGAIIALAFLFLWLANNYHPFIDAPMSVYV